MTDGQRQAAAWLQIEGFTLTDTPGGFIAVHGFAQMWVQATERKTIIGRSGENGHARMEVRKIASVDLVRELINGFPKAQPAPMEPWQARAVLKAAADAEPATTGG